MLMETTAMNIMLLLMSDDDNEDDGGDNRCICDNNDDDENIMAMIMIRMTILTIIKTISFLIRLIEDIKNSMKTYKMHLLI